MSKKKFYLLLGALITLVGYVFGSSQNSINPPTFPTPITLSASDSANLIKVTRVVDGDTIEIEGGAKVRYIGINAPESVAPGKPMGCFGKESSNKNIELVLGKEVRLEKDVSETDKYGRLLRYVYVEGPSTSSGQISLFVNDELVKSGYARVSTYPPDVKYQDLFRQSEKYARENNSGLWGKCF